MSKLITILMLLICPVIYTGCTTTPIQDIVKGQLLGSGAENVLHQVELIAYHAALVRDPDMTDAEFYEMIHGKTQDEFNKWVAEKNYEIRRAVNLLNPYSALTGGNTENEEIIKSISGFLDRLRLHQEDIQYAKYLRDLDKSPFGKTNNEP